MFLHSGAALHRHEYSAPLERQTTTSIMKRSSLSRSPFSAPVQRRASAYEIPTPIMHLPGRPVSELFPRDSEHTVRFREPEAIEGDKMSEDSTSLANSETSETTTGDGRRRRRPPRTSTAFHLAHPAPTLTQKQRLVQIRPKLLLQLQRLSSDSRPKPAVDVLPSALVVPRLAKKFPRMFRGKAELGANDVMIVRSEDYDAPDHHSADETESDEEGMASRDLMAVICQMRKVEGRSHGKAEIVLGDGTVWVATPLSNGLYEFNTVDESGHRTTARWVKRSAARSSADMSTIASAGNNNDVKFTFSIIDPNSRRHPIMASITQNKLDIPDFYTSVSTSAGKYPPTSPVRPQPREFDNNLVDEEVVQERTTHAINENLKTLIQVTGIWVALRQEWSPYFKYNDTMTVTATSTHARPPSRIRSLSLTPDSVRPVAAGTGSSTPDSCHSTFGAVGDVFRRKGCQTGRASPQFELLTAPPKRSISAGSAFMQRAAARRAGHPPSTVASDSEGEGVAFELKRGATDPGTLSNGILSNQISTLRHVSTPTQSVPQSSVMIPDTPTKPRRRVQSAYIPNNLQQDEFTKMHTTLHTMEISNGKQVLDPGEKPKAGRWRTIVNFFRKSD